MARTIGIGIQDFSKIIGNNYFYVDKTGFIKEWWENGDDVTLITRPRRFGKTLTMNMLYHFFSVDHAERSGLFQNLDIWKEEKYQKLQGTYPVIFLSFANVKADTYQEAYSDICRLIAREYRRFAFILDSDCFLPVDREQFFKYVNGNASESDISASFDQLSEYLYHYYKKRVIILLDEYDTPMQEAYVNGYWEKLTKFIRKLLHSAFKTNPYLERAIMTGITRVGKESVFSDLNNLVVVTTTSRKYETFFGFTEAEVFQALEEYGLRDKAQEVKRWYDGFRFGACGSIYNPWSITQFLEEQAFASYWANTSSNRLAGKLIQQGSPEVKIAVEDLLQGKTILTVLDEQVVFDQLDEDDNSIWSFLLASGYLKIESCRVIDPDFGEDGLQYELALTNLEIVSVFRKMVYRWFSNKRYGFNGFLKALLAADLVSMNAYMNQVAMSTISFFDSGNKACRTEPERFYHGFVLGLIVDLGSRYRITSNRESGLGRYDVLLEPCNSMDDGIIFEFKVRKPEVEDSLKDTAKAAIRQIVDKKYGTVLEAKCSRDKIRIYGFAFSGKDVLIEGGCLSDYDKGDL